MAVSNAASKVQQLIQQARITFSSREKVIEDDVKKLQNLMKTMTADDFNVTPEMAKESWDYFPFVSDAPATCMEVYENSNVSVGIFMVKAKSSMPLHDHPNMHGIMKVLFGSMEVTSYDKGEEAGSYVCKGSELLTPSSEPWKLSPNSRNIHEIQAQQEAVAFLDILSPPYNPKEGRDCIYYHRKHKVVDKPECGQSEMLTPGKNPSWFSCVPQAYPGPKVDAETLQ